MATMAIMSLTLMLAMCTFLLPVTGQESSLEPMALRAGNGWAHWPHRPQWPLWPRCGWGEVYKQCVSSSCGEKRCSEIGRSRPGCTRDCASGCFCWNNLYRNKRGRCVPKWQCRRGGVFRPVPYGAK
uniref:TIL domain containing protein n=1 Tax=Rhipicephalus appendiculatus TaxID=34631 RepID=A0A131Z3F9_RHIAP